MAARRENWTNAVVAEKTGVTDKTVGPIRDDREATAEIPQSPTRTGADGRATDTTNIGRTPATSHEEVMAEKNESWTDRDVALKCGVDHKTVAPIRDALVLQRRFRG